MGQADPIDFEAREREQESLQQRDSEALEAEIRELRWLMSGPKGRAYAWRLLKDSDVFWQQSSTNALANATYEGRRMWAMHTFRLLHSKPDLFQL